MRISLNWLKELIFLPKNITAQEISEKLTMAGFEVEALESFGDHYKDVVNEVLVDNNLEFCFDD